MTSDTAPKTDRKPTKVTAPPKTERKPRGGRPKSLKKPLEDLITSAGTTVALFNQVDGIAIVNGATDLATALNNVAKDNPTVHKNLTRLVTGSAWGSVFVAVSAIALPIAANHNLLPFQIPGVAIPEPAVESADIPDVSTGHVPHG